MKATRKSDGKVFDVSFDDRCDLSRRLSWDETGKLYRAWICCFDTGRTELGAWGRWHYFDVPLAGLSWDEAQERIREAKLDVLRRYDLELELPLSYPWALGGYIERLFPMQMVRSSTGETVVIPSWRYEYQFMDDIDLVSYFEVDGKDVYCRTKSSEAAAEGVDRITKHHRDTAALLASHGLQTVAEAFS